MVFYKEKATFKQLKVYGEMTILQPLNPKCPDIVLKNGEKYHIVGKVEPTKTLNVLEICIIFFLPSIPPF